MRKIRAPRARPRKRAQKSDDYDVGYGKPPVHSRFKPGQSGNSKGRPKGVRNFKTDVQATLKAPVKVTRGGKPRNVSTQAAMLCCVCARRRSAEITVRSIGCSALRKPTTMRSWRSPPACPPTMRRSSRFSGRAS